MTNLIERLEAATGPDRALDAELHCALFKPKQYADDLRYFRVPHASMDHMDMCEPGTYWLKERSGRSLHTAPQYTAKFDIAQLVALLRAQSALVLKAAHDGLSSVQERK